MEYFLKIKTTFDTLLKIDKLSYTLNKNGFLTFKINIKENESFIITSEPLIQTKSLIFPYKIYIKNINNQLEINSNNIDCYNYLNNYIIYLKKFEAIKDMNILASSQNYLVFNTYCTNLSTTNNCFNLNELFTNITIKKVNNNSCILLNNDTKKYIIVLHNNEIIYKDYYDEIKLDKCVEIFSKINDIAKHAIITKIENNNVSNKVVYVNNAPNVIENDMLIPLAFLQALKIDNLKLCKFYLNNNLKDVCTLDNLHSYFGNFKKIEPILDERSLVLFYEDKSYKIINFEIENQKIKKIEVKN